MQRTAPYDISRLLTNLVGKEVNASLLTSAPPSKAVQVFGDYDVLPSEEPLVVKADLAVLAVLAGSMLGLPAESAMARAQENPMDESIRDASYEILNVLSAVIGTEGRVVFKKMSRDTSTWENDALGVVQKPTIKSCFQVAMAGKPLGLLNVYSSM